MSIRETLLTSLLGFVITGDIAYAAQRSREFWSSAAAEKRRVEKRRVNITFK